MPFDDFMSFFLGLVDRALVHLFLKPDFVHISVWNQTLASTHPYLHDVENSLAFTNTTYRVLVSRGFFAFVKPE